MALSEAEQNDRLAAILDQGRIIFGWLERMDAEGLNAISTVLSATADVYTENGAEPPVGHAAFQRYVDAQIKEKS